MILAHPCRSKLPSLEATEAEAALRFQGSMRCRVAEAVLVLFLGILSRFIRFCLLGALDESSKISSLKSKA